MMRPGWRRHRVSVQPPPGSSLAANCGVWLRCCVQPLQRTTIPVRYLAATERTSEGPHVEVGVQRFVRVAQRGVSVCAITCEHRAATSPCLLLLLACP